MPEPVSIGFGTLVTGARLLGNVFDRGPGITVEQFREQRRTPAGRELELGRRGEPTRDQIISDLGVTLPRSAVAIPPSAAPPPGIMPPGLPTSPGEVPLLIPVPPTAIPPLLPVGIVGSIPNVPGYPPSPPPSAGPSPIITARGGVPAREAILRRQGAREAERLFEREAVQRARGAAIEAAARRSAILRGVLRVGTRVIGTLPGILWPSDINPGVPTPEQIREMEREAARVQQPELRRVTVPRQRIEQAVRSMPPGTDHSVLQEVTVGATRRTLPQRAPAPTSRPAPATTTGRIRQSMLGRLPWAQILLGALIGSSSRTSVSTSVAPIISGLTRVEPDPLPSTGGPPLSIPPSVVTGQCDCPPKKKRKKPRKCLERGQVIWKTGRNKGKVAGTKCVRFATK